MAKTNATTTNALNPQGLMRCGMRIMSSKEIASLTGKRHDHVVRDIRKMLKALDAPNLGHEEYQELTDERGYTKEFLLNEELTLTLVSGYNVKMRNAIIKRWKELEAAEQLPLLPKVPSCLPVIHNESVVLMFYRDAEYWVSFRGLCDAARLDYKWFLRSLGYEYDAREIDQGGESVLCLSFGDALTWLRGLRPEKVQFKKRHFVVSAMLRLPELLEGARDRFERDVRSSRVCESRLVDGDYVRVHRRELSRYYSEMSRIVSGSVQEMRATTEAFECSQGIDDGAEFRVNEARGVIAGYCGGEV